MNQNTHTQMQQSNYLADAAMNAKGGKKNANGAFLKNGLNQLPLTETAADTSLDELMEQMDTERKQSAYNRPLHEVVGKYS